jgi:hypothetical protein
MTDKVVKATKEQIEKAQRLLSVAGLSPDTRMECEGMIALGIESQVAGLTKNLEKLMSEKEEAYIEYKKAVKEALLSASRKSD